MGNVNVFLVLFTCVWLEKIMPVIKEWISTN